MPIDSIHLLFGRDYRDQPEVRRALELADTKWRTLAWTGQDHTQQHRDFLRKTANDLLQKTGTEIAIDAVQRGMARSETRPAQQSQAAGRVVDHGNGTCTVYLDDAPSSPAYYGNGSGRSGPEVVATRAPNGFSSDPSKFPGASDARDQKARLERHKQDGRGGYIDGAAVEGDSRRYVPEEGRDPGGDYGDSRLWTSTCVGAVGRVASPLSSTRMPVRGFAYGATSAAVTSAFSITRSPTSCASGSAFGRLSCPILRNGTLLP
jgi:hypothetical protein